MIVPQYKLSVLRAVFLATSFVGKCPIRHAQHAVLQSLGTSAQRQRGSSPGQSPKVCGMSHLIRKHSPMHPPPQEEGCSYT